MQLFSLSQRSAQSLHPQPNLIRFAVLRGLALSCAALAFASTLVGCGAPVSTPVPTSTTSPVGYIYLTGNWLFTLTQTSGPTPFSSLAGFINETDQTPGTYDLTTSVFQSSPASNCYADATTIPSQGSTKGNDYFTSSFSVDGQFLYITATKNAAADQLTGTYLVTDGCAAESRGNLIGNKYATLTGTYSGQLGGVTTTQNLQVDLTQATQGTGDGYFLMSGTATATGSPCFTSATVDAAGSTVVGNKVMITLDTTGGDATQVVLTGTFDITADTINFTSIQGTGSGSCSGSLGNATLTS